MKKQHVCRTKKNPNKDNSRYITIRLNDEQYELLRELMAKTTLPQTTLLRTLIDGKPLHINFHEKGFSLYTESNMIYSNVRQIARNEMAWAMDGESVRWLQFLADKMEYLIHEIMG